MESSPSIKVMWERARHGIALFTAGGAWAAQLPTALQHSLRWYYMDGVFAAGQEAINATYISIYVLAMGATSGQIGLMTSLASLASMILLLPGAILAERSGSRKWVVVASGGGMTRLAILGLALLPFFANGATAVAIAIGLKVIMDGFSNLGNPAWTSLTADLVPMTWRGRFFGNRNMVIGVATVLVTLLAGQVITASGSPLRGYQTVYFLALLFGACATYCFAHIKEPAPSHAGTPNDSYRLSSLVQTLRGDPVFLSFCAAQMVWNFSLAVAGPFFGIYQIEVLKSTAFIIGIQAIISSMAGLPFLPLFGRLNDRWGSRKLAIIIGFAIPVMPLAWTLVRGPWGPTLINVYGGIMWAGYGLASFNLLLSITDPTKKARYSALFAMSVMISAAAGSAVGGLIIQHVGYITIFIVSGVGRTLGNILLWRLVKPPLKEPVPSGD
jgi:MFS family permease